MAESESQGLVASRPLTTTTGSSSRCIRIHTDVDNDNDIPIWALIEVNGELLEPKNDENAVDIDETTTTTTTLAEGRRIRMDPDYMELGAVHFVDQQVGTARRGSL